MNDDQIRALLKKVDEGSWPTALPGGSRLVIRIRAEARRRHTRNRVVLAACGLLVAALVPLGISRWSLPQVVMDRDPPLRVTARIAERAERSGEEIKQLRHELAHLDAEARHAQAVADALAHRRRLAELQDRLAELAAPAPLHVIADAGRDRAAQIGVIAAAALAEKFDQPVAAAESYRSVVEHFPESRWATVARERLEQMEHMN
jgi:hypothetical protein